MAVCSTGAGSASPVVSMHHAAEGGAAIVEIAQQVLQRVDEVAAHRAAQAAALQQHHVVVDMLDQQMVEADLAELVDDDGGLGERRVLEQPVEQRGLAGAEEAGEHGQRDGLAADRARRGGGLAQRSVDGSLAWPGGASASPRRPRRLRRRSQRRRRGLRPLRRCRSCGLRLRAGLAAAGLARRGLAAAGMPARGWRRLLRLRPRTRLARSRRRRRAAAAAAAAPAWLVARAAAAWSRRRPAHRRPTAHGGFSSRLDGGPEQLRRLAALAGVRRFDSISAVLRAGIGRWRWRRLPLPRRSSFGGRALAVLAAHLLAQIGRRGIDRRQRIDACRATA